MNRVLWVVLVAVLVGVILGAWTLLDQPIQRLSVVSEISPGERAELEQTLAQLDVGNILTADLHALRTALADLGWTRSISIRRRWPDVLEIDLQRAQPIARWGADQFITASGELVDMPDSTADLPTFDVALDSPKQAMQVFSLIDQLVRPHHLEVAALNQNRSGEWQVTFKSGEDALIGAHDVHGRMNRLLEVYATATRSEREVARFDLRYGSGVAVKFRPSPEGDLLAGNH